jgi:hypothetical protein
LAGIDRNGKLNFFEVLPTDNAPENGFSGFAKTKPLKSILSCL